MAFVIYLLLDILKKTDTKDDNLGVQWVSSDMFKQVDTAAILSLTVSIQYP